MNSGPDEPVPDGFLRRLQLYRDDGTEEQIVIDPAKLTIWNYIGSAHHLGRADS